MGILSILSGGIVVALGTVAVAAIGRQLQSEFQDWTPTATSWLVDRAVRRLPADKQERFREEWLAHLADVPGQVWKWRIAAGYLLAARRMAPRPRHESVHEPVLVARIMALGMALINIHRNRPSLALYKAFFVAYRDLIVTSMTPAILSLPEVLVIAAKVLVWPNRRKD